MTDDQRIMEYVMLTKGKREEELTDAEFYSSFDMINPLITGKYGGAALQKKLNDARAVYKLIHK